MRLGAFLQYNEYTVSGHKRVGRSTCRVHPCEQENKARPVPVQQQTPHPARHTHTHTHTHTQKGTQIHRNTDTRHAKHKTPHCRLTTSHPHTWTGLHLPDLHHGTMCVAAASQQHHGPVRREGQGIHEKGVLIGGY